MSLALKMKLWTTAIDHLQTDGAASRKYALMAVSGKENEPWSKWTPNGKLEFTVTNPDAPALEPGEYLVTLEKC